jgi:predicted alpha-1,2-mannosidase
VLGRIAVDGGSAAERRVFATALYHAHLMPHDLSGENAWWRSRAPHYEDLFTLWDSFRTVNPLLALVEPRREAAIVRSLLDGARHTGWLADGRVAGNDGLTQVGSNAEVVLGDAVVKRLPGVSRAAAYRAVSRDADVSSPHPVARGRRLAAYRRLGYVPLGERASASRTLEYSYEDFAAAEVAAAAGHPRRAARYLARSRSWRNLWDPSTRYVRPRRAAGGFVAGFDPDRFYSDWRAPFYEGTSLQWSTFVPHDAAGLIARVGGDGAMVDWLGRLFAARYGARNEVDLLAPFLYTHAGRPDLAARELRDQRARGYSAARAGLPGNDDGGALSAWYVWSALGLYPNAGQPFYYLSVPLFDRARVALPHGRAFTVIRHGPADGVIVAATLDGLPLDRAWVTHDELARGGELDVVTGPVPVGWGTRPRPPSPAS